MTVKDTDVLAAWNLLADRGLVKIEWQGLVPDVMVNAGLLFPDCTADSPPCDECRDGHA